MKLKKSKPMQWVILVILLFIFAGIMVDALHSRYESKLTLNTSQRQVQADASALLSSLKLTSDQPQNYQLGYHNFGMVQKKGILVNTMSDEFFPFWYALFVHMMFKNLGNLCDSFKSLKA